MTASSNCSPGGHGGRVQLESTGQRQKRERLRPDRFKDHHRHRGAYPPAINNIPTYINRKHGEEPVATSTRSWSPILQTYRVIIHEEQVDRDRQGHAR